MEQQPRRDEPIAKRRRWWQFTLRSLLVLMLVLSLPLAWVGNELAGKRREQEIADAIQKAGGSAVYSDVNRFHIPNRLYGPWKSDDPFDSESWTQASRLIRVELHRGDPAEFRALLTRLKQIEYLRELDLSYTHLRDADLQEVEQLTRLTDLNLAGAHVGDEGIGSILRLPKLQKLILDYTIITDDGLKELAGLPSLRDINLTGTQVTGPGIARLLNERPDLHVTCEGHLSSGVEVIGARGLHLHGWRTGFWESVPDGPLGAIFGERKEDLSKLELDCLKSLKRLDLTISLGAPRSINAVLPELGLERLQTSNEVNSGDLRSLTRCRNLRCLILWQPELSDGDYATFQEFPRLEMLELSSMKLTSRGIEDIASVKSLRCLSLYSGKFRTMDLAPLARLAALDELRLMWAHFFAPSATEPLGQLKKVKVLNLSHSNLDDAGLLPLLDLSELEFLDVGDTQITDEGLMRLAMIKSLKDLRLSYFGNVTKEGRERFSKLRPDVKVDN